jgi:hypothetical protein
MKSIAVLRSAKNRKRRRRKERNLLNPLAPKERAALKVLHPPLQNPTRERLSLLSVLYLPPRWRSQRGEERPKAFKEVKRELSSLHPPLQRQVPKAPPMKKRKSLSYEDSFSESIEQSSVHSEDKSNFSDVDLSSDFDPAKPFQPSVPSPNRGHKSLIGKGHIYKPWVKFLELEEEPHNLSEMRLLRQVVEFVKEVYTLCDCLLSLETSLRDHYWIIDLLNSVKKLSIRDLFSSEKLTVTKFSGLPRWLYRKINKSLLQSKDIRAMRRFVEHSCH